jgi:site-specific DNA-methyltransferase (adenine-specific)
MKINPKGKGNDVFQTPKFLFDKLNSVFQFTVDVACSSTNKLCDRGFCFDQGINGLEESWAGQRVFCNPPFSEKGKWMEKAHKEVSDQCPVVVMILPTNSMDSKPWHEYVYGKYYYEILSGRVSFLDPETKEPASGNNSGTTIIYFWKKPGTK